MTRLRTLHDLPSVASQQVLVRVDADVPSSWSDERPPFRLRRALLTLSALQKKRARVVVAAHRGRPEGRASRSLNLEPVMKFFGQNLAGPVQYERGMLVGKKAESHRRALRPGSVLFLENVRFHPGEEKNDLAFARELAKGAAFFVNDAFGASHRPHASVSAVSQLLPSFAGLALEREVAVLSRILGHPRRPFFLVLGGVKTETKIPVLKHLLPKVNRIFLAGAVANTFLAATGRGVGTSEADPKVFSVARVCWRAGKEKIVLPSDARVMGNDGKEHVRGVSEIRDGEQIVNIGPRAARALVREVLRAKTVVWNGPLGVCETGRFCESTRLFARALASLRGAATVVGGGDTTDVIEAEGLEDRFTHVSTGGGAMLAFLSGVTLPGLEFLWKKSVNK